MSESKDAHPQNDAGEVWERSDTAPGEIQNIEEINKIHVFARRAIAGRGKGLSCQRLLLEDSQ